MKASLFPAVPRLESLHHRLKNAKGRDGEPLVLLDELMVFLEDPPPAVGDRWQAGAELCAEHGVSTSRMSVWRFYRAQVLQWRREQAPSLAQVAESTTQLLDQARHLVALRAVESLHHPHLSPRILVGLVQNENRRQELQLARDKFNDQLETRQRLERQRHLQRIDDEARDRALLPFHLNIHRASSRPSPKPPSPKEASSKSSPPQTSTIPLHNTP